MNVLLLGSEGQLGKAFLSDEREGVRYVVVGGRYPTNARQIEAALMQTKLSFIINCVAYTNVNNAEFESDLCNSANVELPEFLAQLSKKYNVPLIHFSTDYVYGEHLDLEMLSESTQTKPMNYYGASKLMGEIRIRDIGCDCFCFRISWIYSDIKKNFLLAIFDKLKRKEEPSVIDFERGSPTTASFVARAILAIIQTNHIPRGLEIFNLAPQGNCSRYEFACSIKDVAAELGLVDSVLKIHRQSAGIVGNVLRQKNSILNTDKFAERFFPIKTTWQDELKVFEWNKLRMRNNSNEL